MKSISRRGTGAGHGCVVRVMGLVFMLIGSGVAIGLSGLPLYNWYGAQDWPAVPCTVVSSEVRTHSSSDGTTYSIAIHYAYTWEGRQYESDQYNFFGGSSSGYNSKQAVVDAYPAGATRECFVNPENPGEAVLARGFSFTYLIGSFGLIFVLVGAFMLFGRLGSPRERGISSSGMRPAGAVSEAIPAPALDAGRITLKGGNNSLIGFVFLLIFAVIWNGITYIALWNTLGQGDGGFDMVATLFLIPFVLIGLALLGGVLYFFLTLFNPRPDLTLSPGYLPLGGTAMIGWAFRGNASRICKLTITLQGQEAATYRRGTSSTTDRSIFEKIVIVETEVAAEIRQGEVAVTVPEFTAPTFNAPNNKIQWQVKVHGDIRRWPDVNEEFELVVSPLPADPALRPVPAEFRQV